MLTNILFIFEGEKTENVIVKSLEKSVFKDEKVIKCAFAADIYQLYETFSKDEYLDIFSSIRTLNERNAETLKGYDRDDFSEIHLFFDYDGNATDNKRKTGDDKIKEMLDYFNNETEQGKLYISYPMVEAIRHFEDHDSFKELKAKCKGRNCPNQESCKDVEVCLEEPHYKCLVGTQCPKMSNMNQYTSLIWKGLINAHLCKMNYVVNDSYSFPEEFVVQSVIFERQLAKYIRQSCPQVAVLSAFPLWIFDYYGSEGTKEKLMAL